MSKWNRKRIEAINFPTSMLPHTFQQFLKEMQSSSSPWPQDPRASYQIPLAFIEIVETGRNLWKSKSQNEAWIYQIHVMTCKFWIQWAPYIWNYSRSNIIPLCITQLKKGHTWIITSKDLMQVVAKFGSLWEVFPHASGWGSGGNTEVCLKAAKWKSQMTGNVTYNEGNCEKQNHV